MSTWPIPEQHVHVGLPFKDLYDHFLVQCPHCAACAKVVHVRRIELPLRSATARVTCPGCGKVEQRNCRIGDLGKPSDPYFCLLLWLQRSCCGKTLWAYNLHHVAFLEAYVAATQRSRRLFEITYVGEDHATDRLWLRNRNQLSYLAQRLPKWMTSAKNRKEVLRGIACMRELALS